MVRDDDLVAIYVICWVCCGCNGDYLCEMAVLPHHYARRRLLLRDGEAPQFRAEVVLHWEAASRLAEFDALTLVTESDHSIELVADLHQPATAGYGLEVHLGDSWVGWLPFESASPYFTQVQALAGEGLVPSALALLTLTREPDGGTHPRLLLALPERPPPLPPPRVHERAGVDWR